MINSIMRVLESQLESRQMNTEHPLSLTELDVNPAYLHGVWCGLIVGGQYCPPQDWLDIALDEPDVWEMLSVQAQATLLHMAEKAVIDMSADDFSFQLLLPEDDAPLQERADAFNEWCLGFMLGIKHQRGQQTLLTGDGAQALSDITKIGEMDLDTTECEEEEASYIELVEFVRIAVLTIHQNFLENASNSKMILPTYFH
jgi:uncharacterized protein